MTKGRMDLGGSGGWLEDGWDASEEVKAEGGDGKVKRGQDRKHRGWRTGDWDGLSGRRG